MKKITFYALVGLLLLLLTNCSDEAFTDSSEGGFSLDSGSGGSSGSSGVPGNGQGSQSGLITAGEWNDLDNWQFWNGLMNDETYSGMPDYWNFYNNNRVSIQISNIIDANLVLSNNGETVWEAKTDNYGKAEMWIDLFQSNQAVNMADYSLSVNGQTMNLNLKLHEEGINEIELAIPQIPSNRVELSFIVDATGSMTDEVNFLKDDLIDVIQRVENDNPDLDIHTSSVFYRDEGDDYLVKKSEFSNDLNTTLDFINEQSASGGGDFPEAVHTAMTTGIEELQWSETARTRIAFLLLDAPPHHTGQVIEDLQKSIETAAKKGIKIIPVTASGIDKETEFLMRFFSISTNSTYTFITNDSGIGNDHIEASVGEYEVEFLNDLMVRLIKKYSE